MVDNIGNRLLIERLYKYNNSIESFSLLFQVGSHIPRLIRCNRTSIDRCFHSTFLEVSNKSRFYLS